MTFIEVNYISIIIGMIIGIWLGMLFTVALLNLFRIKKYGGIRK
ncbi:MAG: hypothetical protein Q4C64_04135 [Erysipelotrichia bacterium]|nr:hypothetical protein [Erysipelotrichia bacterium]